MTGNAKGETVAPSERLRVAAAVVALAAGIPAVVALATGLADPATGTVAFLVAALFLAAGGVAALALRLVAERRRQRVLAARLETMQDLSWELSDARSQRASDAAIPIAMVSHEMRAPLHGMLALADLLAGTELTLEQRAYLAALNQSASGLARLVDDLLDASRIATGQFSLSPAPVEIEALVEDVAELLAPRAHERGIGLGARIAPGLPAVAVDGGRLRQVLINLVTNGIEATESGAVLIAVDPADGPAETGLALTFAVHDSGPGVDGADRDRIFGSFERARADGSGLGLGLSISQQIIGRMGGRIDVDARAGGGAVFHFTLPLTALGQPAHPPAPLRNVSVVLAAPRSLETETLAILLEEAGAEVRVANSLAEAAGLVGAAQAAGQPYRMVLADARVASDARAALKRLRDAAGGALPVAILVDTRERRAVEALRADGFDAYLIRPVRRRSLVSVIAEASRLPDRFISDPADAPGRPPAERRGNRPLDVLVVEDDPVSALLARAVLERLGHEVDEARTIAAARERLTDRPDVALVDLKLGDGDGLGLIAAFAAADGEAGRPALIAMSGDAAARSAALAAGADLFLEKPVSAERLCRAFEEALSRQRTGSGPRHQTA